MRLPNLPVVLPGLNSFPIHLARISIAESGFLLPPGAPGQILLRFGASTMSDLATAVPGVPPPQRCLKRR